MRSVRVAAFVLVGIILGVVGARVKAKTKRSRVAAIPSPSSGEATSRATPTWTGFAYNHSVPQRELLPTDARYDPVALSKEEDDLSSKEIFEREPRDPVFAPVMEKRIQAIHDIVFHELQLKDKIGKVYIECKTLSCYTAIEVAKADGEQVYEELSGILLGDVQTPNLVDDPDPELSDVVIYNLYRPATRDPAYYKRFLEEAMRQPLEFIKRKFLTDQKEQGAQHEARH